MSVGTGFLWWTYYGEYKDRTQFNQTDEFQIPLTDIDMQTETAFLILSIVATVFTVRFSLFLRRNVENCIYFLLLVRLICLI